jgi:hypothetical protein
MFEVRARATARGGMYRRICAGHGCASNHGRSKSQKVAAKYKYREELP